MKNHELLLGQSSERKTPQTRKRRSPVLLALLAGTALLAAACSGKTPENSTTVPAGPALLKPPATVSVGGNHWFDTGLAQTPDPFLRSLEFYFDPGYSGGSLAMVICFNKSSGEFRITSRQINQNPGYLFNRPFDITQPCQLLHPVTNVTPDENDWVNIGVRSFDQPYNNTYTGRGYSVTRIGNSQTIGVYSLGRQTLDPDTIHPRDPQTAGDYFKR